MTICFVNSSSRDIVPVVPKVANVPKVPAVTVVPFVSVVCVVFVDPAESADVGFKSGTLEIEL